MRSGLFPKTESLPYSVLEYTAKAFWYCLCRNRWCIGGFLNSYWLLIRNRVSLELILIFFQFVSWFYKFSAKVKREVKEDNRLLNGFCGSLSYYVGIDGNLSQQGVFVPQIIIVFWGYDILI